MIWIYTLSSVVAVSLVSLVGVVTFAWQESRLRETLFLLVALSAGALFGDVFIHLLPEIFISDGSTLLASLGIMLGIVIFFILEKFLHWHHHHSVDDCDHPEHHAVAPMGHLSLFSDGLHNFIDGLIIGASFLISPSVGLASTLAVILHEIPQEIGDLAILIQSGFSKVRAVLLNLLSALLAVLGAVVALVLGAGAESVSAIVLPLAAGGFLYLAGSDLVPELHKITDPKKSLLQLLAMIMGIALMALLVFFE